MEKTNLTIVTHNGVFHTDDVFATAFVEMVYHHEANIIRTRDVEELKEYIADTRVYVLDVGNNYEPEFRNFDHHHIKTELSSFGMVVDYLLDQEDIVGLFKDQNAVTWFLRKLVVPIDLFDNNINNIIDRVNGMKLFTIQSIIGMFNTIDTNNDGHQSYVFRQAVDLAKGIIHRSINKANSRSDAMIVFNSFAKIDSKVVILPFYIPFWQEFASKHKVKLGIFKEKEHWVISTVDRNIVIADHEVGREFRHKDGFVAKYNIEAEAYNCINKTLNNK